MSIEQNAKISAPVASFAAQLVACANFSVTQSLRVESKTNEPPGSEGKDWGKIMGEGAGFHLALAKPPEHKTSLPHQDLEK